MHKSLNLVIDGEEATIIGYTGNEASVTILSTVEINVNNKSYIYKITKIGKGAFSNIKQLREVNIDEGLEYIQDKAAHCITLHNNTAPTIIQGAVFLCFNLVSVINNAIYLLRHYGEALFDIYSHFSQSYI